MTILIKLVFCTVINEGLWLPLCIGVKTAPANIKKGFKKAFAEPWPERLRYEVCGICIHVWPILAIIVHVLRFFSVFGWYWNAHEANSSSSCIGPNPQIIIYNDHKVVLVIEFSDDHGTGRWETFLALRSSDSYGLFWREIFRGTLPSKFLNRAKPKKLRSIGWILFRLEVDGSCMTAFCQGRRMENSQWSTRSS